MKELNYVLNNQELKVSLNLYEAERYENAVIIQPLIGNLIAYSNKGRYSPLIAKSWAVSEDGVWAFEFNKGFKCDNGEEITPSSYKRSLELSIKYLASKDNVPIFSKLVGFDQFVSGKSPDISGIEATESNLAFRFIEPTRSGVIQSLSFAPFGYICSENRNEDGSWKDDKTFISSGAYRVVQHFPGEKHVLELRKPWSEINEKSPKKINFYFSMNKVENKGLPTILDSFTKVVDLSDNLKNYKLVPEYLNAIILSPNSNGNFFSQKENRLIFKKALEAEKEKLPKEINNHVKSSFYYPNQAPKNLIQEAPKNFFFQKPTYPLTIQGKKPEKGSKWYLNWSVIEGALKSLAIDYVFDDSGKTYYEKVNNKYDIRYIGSAIGGGAQAWGVSFQFCSDIGSKFPDPSGEICSSIVQFEKGLISEEQFADNFNQRVYDDASVIPLTHYGIMLYLSPEISRDSISPLVSVMRFEQLELE